MRIYNKPEQLQKLLGELQESYKGRDFAYCPVLTSGYFDPIHSGHIAYLKSACHYGNIWITAINSNECAIKKKGYYLIDEQERAAIVCSLKYCHYSVVWGESDVSNLIRLLKPRWFCNGGDVTVANKDEDRACREVGAQQIFDCGTNNKQNSSSKIIKDFISRYPIVNTNIHA
jgi:cytidyltransferase-like protein